MTMPLNALAFLGRHATTMMAFGVFSGLALPGLAIHLQPWLSPMVWLLMAVSMVQIRWADAVAHLKRPVLLGATLVWMLCVTPVLMWLIVKDASLSPGLIVALVLTAATSPLMSTPAVGMIIGLDAAFLLLVLVLETLLVPLTLPIVSANLVEVPISTLDLMQRLAVFVFSSVAAAVLLQRFLGETRIDAARDHLHGASVILLVGFAAGLMAGIPAAFQEDPGHVAFVTALSFAVFAGLQLAGMGAFWALGRAMGRGWDRVKILSVAFVSGNRNMAILIAVLFPAIAPDTMLYFMVGQFPIYLVPAVWEQVVERLL